MYFREGPWTYAKTSGRCRSQGKASEEKGGNRHFDEKVEIQVPAWFSQD